MKILLVTEFYPPAIMGGGEINVHEIATMLARKKIKVVILTSPTSLASEDETVNGVRIIRKLKTGSNPNSLFQNIKRCFFLKLSLKKEIELLIPEIKPDLIHFIGNTLIVAPVLAKINLPLCATIESYPALCPKGDRLFHGDKECAITCSLTEFFKCQWLSSEIGKMKNRWYLRYNPLFLGGVYWYHAQLRKALGHCNLIAISGYVQKILTQYGQNSTIVPNSVNVPQFKNNKLSIKPNKSTAKIKVLYIGSLVKYKGPQILLRALQELEVHCDIYGNGNLKPELERMIQDKKLDVTIHPPVPYEEIISIYHSADIVVFPSLWPEPFGRITIEAMAAGKPVVGSQIGGIKEVITPGTGIVFEPGNVEQLHDALSLLVHNPALRQKMGTEGQKQVQREYGQEIIITKLIQNYQSIIQRPTASLSKKSF